MSIPRLYVVVDAETLLRRNISLRDFARELAEAGVRLVQYRDKIGGPQEILRAVEEIERAFAGTETRMVLNDRADLAALRGWGVHVGQGDLPVAAALALVRTVGVSTHTGEQVRAANAAEALCAPMSQSRDIGHPAGATYIAVGPVFATSSKQDAEPVVGLEGVRRARALTTKPLVAIGGIALENCVSVMEAGADSVAVISGVFVEGRGVGEVVRDFLERLR